MNFRGLIGDWLDGWKKQTTNPFHLWREVNDTKSHKLHHLHFRLKLKDFPLKNVWTG